MRSFLWTYFILFLDSTAAFSPTVKTRCLNGFMSIDVQTEQPWLGIAYPPTQQSECSLRGIGLTNTVLNIPLNADGICGVEYLQASESYRLILEIHEHHMIILKEDKVFNLTCPVGPTPASGKGTSPIRLGLYNSTGHKVHTVLFGDVYKVRLESLSGEDFVVSSCMGFAGFNYSLELATENGCSKDHGILSSFYHDSITKTAEATLNSMFRFPKYTNVHIQCGVVLCGKDCPNRIYDCDRRRDEPLALQQSQRLRDIEFASTTVHVDDVNNHTDYTHTPHCGDQSNILVGLCIIFGILLVFSTVINIAFCIVNSNCALGRETQTEYVDSQTGRKLFWHPYQVSAFQNTLVSQGSEISSKGSRGLLQSERVCY